MENDNIKREPRSGWSFDKRDKAYHSYMFSLQKKNYGIGIREYARTHNLKRDTLRGWIDRYPNGLPYYNADDPSQTAPEPPRGEVQMVKLSPSQLEKPQIHIIPKNECNGSVTIDFYGARINADGHNIVAILVAIKSVSDLSR